MKKLKTAAFVLLTVIMAVLVAATVLEKYYGTRVVARDIYGAVWFVVLWGAMAVCASAYAVGRLRHRRPAFMLHLSLIVILAGALTSYLCGRRGTMHLRAGGEPVAAFADSDGRRIPLPAEVRLEDFRIDYYAGTRAPMDYVSRLSITDSGGERYAEVSMNRILRFRGYRFYQSAYDADGGGATLIVSHDPYGIGITYAGYALLLVSMILLLVSKRGGFRRLLRSGAVKGLATLALLAGASGADAAERAPKTLPADLADELGDLYVYYNDRICPLSTLAADFTRKLYGRPNYGGYSSEQVLAGWLFWYDDWKKQPMIRIKDAGVRSRMGIEGRYARLSDYGGVLDAYALPESFDRGERAAVEKFNIVSMVCTGSMLRIYPYADPQDGALHWASQVDALPDDLPQEEQRFIRRSMNYLNELVAARDFDGAREVIRKLRIYQCKTAGDALPSQSRFLAEKLHNRVDYALPLAVVLAVAGAAAFVHVCRRLARGEAMGLLARRVFASTAAAAALFLLSALALRGYVSGHWPLSNGYETMQFMALCALALALPIGRRFVLALPFGLLAAGLAVAVSSMSVSDPQITPLMPVLSSPLLSVHVMLVMVSYALFAFVMFNGAAGLWLCRSHREQAERLRTAGLAMLYPAVFALAAGIFVGAVWANVSWGRYWGWDPKEVWALVTLLLYALPLHSESLPRFRRPVFFHAFCVAAFLSVLATYFGVNFLLGGMHSYAG